MTKGELIDAVAKSAKVSKLVAGIAVDATFDSIAKAIRKSKRFQVPRSRCDHAKPVREEIRRPAP